jgi:hypothetical protein
VCGGGGARGWGWIPSEVNVLVTMSLMAFENVKCHLAFNILHLFVHLTLAFIYCLYSFVHIQEGKE